jgi:hypothetical protein
VTRRCLLLDYVPARRGGPKPALAVWSGPRKTEVLGLGVRHGAEFDPFPFVSTFPADSPEVWVFAEWAYAAAAMVEEGASLPELEAWVRADSTAMTVSEEPAPTSKKALEERFDTDWMATRPAATDALVFLAKESTAATVRADGDVRLETANGTLLATLSVRRSKPAADSRARWLASLQQPGRESLQVDLSEKPASAQVRRWLKALG